MHHRDPASSVGSVEDEVRCRCVSFAAQAEEVQRILQAQHLNHNVTCPDLFCKSAVISLVWGIPIEMRQVLEDGLLVGMVDDLNVFK